MTFSKKRWAALPMLAAVIGVIMARHLDALACPHHNVVLYHDGWLSGRRYCPLDGCNFESTRGYRRSLREERDDPDYCFGL